MWKSYSPFWPYSGYFSPLNLSVPCFCSWACKWQKNKQFKFGDTSTRRWDMKLLESCVWDGSLAMLPSHQSGFKSRGCLAVPAGLQRPCIAQGEMTLHLTFSNLNWHRQRSETISVMFCLQGPVRKVFFSAVPDAVFFPSTERIGWAEYVQQFQLWHEQ